MSRPALALALSALLASSAGAAAALAADASPASVFLRGMSEVCAPWRDGAEQKALYRSLKTGGWNVDTLPRVSGPWGSAQFQPSRYDGEKRGCGAMLTLPDDAMKAGTTRAVLDWVARNYPKTPMTNQNKPLQLKSGPARGWTWADENTAIVFYVADTISAGTAPHLVLSIKPRQRAVTP